MVNNFNNFNITIDYLNGVTDNCKTMVNILESKNLVNSNFLANPKNMYAIARQRINPFACRVTVYWTDGDEIESRVYPRLFSFLIYKMLLLVLK